MSNYIIYKKKYFFKASIGSENTENHSFHENHSSIHKFRSKNFKNFFTLQESLFIFYPDNLNGIKSFINFLISQLYVRKRPKCLIILSINNTDEIQVIEVLIYAWKKKFLDFTIMEKTSSIYYFNRFECIVYRKNLQDSNIKIFPDKLRNAHNYPLYMKNNYNADEFVHLRSSNKKVEINISPYLAIKFAAMIMNMKVISNNTRIKDPEALDFLDQHG